MAAVSESVAIRQAIRLTLLRSASGEAEEASEMVRDELIKALMAAALNDDHCIRIVDAWIKHDKFRPMPADIYGLAQVVPAHNDIPQPDRHCPACGGTGFRQAWELVTTERRPDGSQYKTTDRISDQKTAIKVKQSIREDYQQKIAIAKATGTVKPAPLQTLYDGVIRCAACAYGRSLALATAERETA